jgi:hypothetical protein
MVLVGTIQDGNTVYHLQYRFNPQINQKGRGIPSTFVPVVQFIGNTFPLMSQSILSNTASYNNVTGVFTVDITLVQEWEPPPISMTAPLSGRIHLCGQMALTP